MGQPDPFRRQPTVPPEGLSGFDIILNKYGTSVAQMFVVVPVVLTAFFGEELFNASAWVVAAVLAYALVHLFEPTISSNLWKVSCIGALWVAVVGGALWLAITNLGGLSEQLQRKLVSAGVGFTVMVPIVALIVSRTKYVTIQSWASYPEALRKAVQVQLQEAKFFKSEARYNVTVKPDADKLDLEIEYSYVVTNRSNGREQWNVRFTSYDRDGTLELKVDDQTIVLDRRHKDSTGWRYPTEIDAGTSANVHCKATLPYRVKDSEFFGTYEPTTDLALSITYPDQVEVFVDFYHPENKVPAAEREQSNGLIHEAFKIKSGLLPFEGIRMDWQPSAGGEV